ncbi:MAG: SusC/RagA family TonB-linked outer membrane protein, partial [Pedobacter sp.]
TGTPLPGAVVKLKTGDNVVYTNTEGRFVLEGVQPGNVIVVTYIGYATREITVNGENASNLRIVMSTDVNKLAEVDVVSTGYQTLPRERSAGSFAKVDMDVVANRTISMNVLQSLDGLVPGLVINNAPLKNQVLIRGLSTVSGAGNLPGQSTTAQPLYVVDGLPVPASNDYDNLPEMILNLNPQDVESITVLKDATAASIWGSRAANGVIVIKTKSGAFNSKMRVNYNTFVNFQGKPDLDYIPTLNSQQYVQTGVELFNAGHTEWRTISGQYFGGGIPPLELILYNQERGLISAERATAQLDSLSRLDNRSQIKDLFYRNALFKPAKALSLYLITDISNNIASGKRNYNVNNFSIPYQMYRDAEGNNLTVPHLTDLSDSLRRDAEGRSRMKLGYNPLDEFDYGSTNRDALMARLNGGFKLDIYRGLSFQGTYGYSKGKNNIRDFESLQSFTVRREIAQFAVAATPANAPRYYIPATGGQLTTINGDQHTWDIRNQLAYDNTFGKHQFTALLGQEAREEFSTSLSSKVRGFDETLLTHANVDWATIVAPIMGTAWPNVANVASAMTAGNDSFRNSEVTNRFTSYFANLAYTFDRRYSLNASWRNDQSNLFGKDKSAQNKPIWSLGGRWNISNEQFMQSVDWLDRLSVRATYGIMGLSPNSGVAASRDITGPTGSAFFPGSIGLRVITPGNPNLSWERTATTNFGLDFSIFRERLSGNVELYNKNTTDLIGVVFPNTLTGFVSITGNQGNLNNKGIEASLSSDNIRSRNFNWSTSLNFAYNKNKLIKVNRAAPITTGAAKVVSGAMED